MENTQLRPENQIALPTVQALERLWAQVSERPLWARPNFWKYLHLRRRSRLRPVDLNTLRILPPAHKINDCSGCTEICCVGPRSTVLLRLHDIATLVDIKRTDLITKMKPSFSHEALAAHPALRRQISTLEWRRFPVLRQDKMGACAALSVHGRCALYPHWPLSCARFPYALIPDDQGAGAQVFYSQRCDSFWIEPEHDAQAAARVLEMSVAAANTYNHRIKDLVLLAYAPEALTDLGLMHYLA